MQAKQIVCIWLMGQQFEMADVGIKKREVGI